MAPREYSNPGCLLEKKSEIEVQVLDEMDESQEIEREMDFLEQLGRYSDGSEEDDYDDEDFSEGEDDEGLSVLEQPGIKRRINEYAEMKCLDQSSEGEEWESEDCDFEDMNSDDYVDMDAEDEGLEDDDNDEDDEEEEEEEYSDDEDYVELNASECSIGYDSDFSEISDIVERRYAILDSDEDSSESTVSWK